MPKIEDQVADHLADWYEQRAAIERFAEMIVAYYQTLVDGGLDEKLVCFLVLQYQAGLLSQIRKGTTKRDGC